MVLDLFMYTALLLQTVFQHIGKALAILITLDHIFATGDTFKEHWDQYKRYHVLCMCVLETPDLACLTDLACPAERPQWLSCEFKSCLK